MSVFEAHPMALTLVLSSVFVLTNVLSTNADAVDRAEYSPYVMLYDEPDDGFELLINQGDGQAFAALAQDPTLSRGEVFRAGKAEASYRAQRPLLGWLGWITSGGQPEAVPAALFGWAIVSAGLLVFAAARLADERSRRRSFAVAALALPGTLITLDWSGPDALAAGLGLIAVWRWERGDRAIAVALLCGAVLARETSLVVVAGIALFEIWRRPRTVSRVATLMVCPGVLAAWWLVVRWRLDAWPTDASQDRLSMPGVGLVEGISRWGIVDGACAMVGLSLVVAAFRRRRGQPLTEDPLWWVLALFGGFALTMGVDVWKRWEDFGRPLLPAYAIALVLALPRVPTGDQSEHAAGEVDRARP